MKTLLTVSGLNAWFGSRQVLTSVGFSIAEGEKVALVGESGSGKTLVAQSVMRLNPDVRLRGAVLFGEEDLLQVTPARLRQIRGQAMSMIFQEPMTALNPLFSIGKQIVEVLKDKLGLPAREAWARGMELLQQMGLDDAAHCMEAYPFQLSGGQRQRAMIAMALACEPSLLIADEPTTALDVTVRGQILELLAKEQQNRNMAILFITHDLNLVRHFADKVVVMHNGVVVESGLVNNVFSRPVHPYTQMLLASKLDILAQPVGSEITRLEARDITVHRQRHALKFWHRAPPVVQSASLNVRQGQTLGIVGESGSGKTTLGLALMRLLPCSGEVLLDGQPLSALKGRALQQARKSFQVVFQDPFSSLSPRMTVGAIVKEGLEVHYPSLSAEDAERKVLAVLAEVGLHKDAIERYPHEFSGGQRQRIAIARALVVHPRLILLDEPTSALDASLQKQVLQLLLSLQQKYGMSYLLISHDLAVIRAMAQQVIVMKSGQVVESGQTNQVLSHPSHGYTKALLASSML